MKNTFYIVALIGFVTACSASMQDNTVKTVSGKITDGGQGKTIFLEYLSPLAAKNVDTTEIDENGEFAFNYEVTEVGYYRVKFSDRNFITLILEPGDQAVLESTWPMGMKPYSVSGSKQSELLQALNLRMQILYNKRDSMNQIFQNNQGNQELMLQMQQEFNELALANQEAVRAFANENPGSFASLAAAEQLNPDVDGPIYKKIDKALGEKYPNSVYYQEFHKTVVKMEKLAIGTEAPDIMLPNPDGEVVALSSLRGKVVLVDFWASWCKPCRMENPNVVRAYNQYKDKGFEVFGVSLDKDRNSWLKAIENDQLFWTQVSDLRFWQSSVVKLYDIEGIPFAVLIDQEGKIIAKNLRGPALTEKLEEILN